MSFFKKIIKNDNLQTGMTLGLTVFAITSVILLIIYYTAAFFYTQTYSVHLLKVLLIACVPNLIIMRNMFIISKKEQIGKGVLIVSFVIIFVVVLLHQIMIK